MLAQPGWPASATHARLRVSVVLATLVLSALVGTHSSQRTIGGLVGLSALVMFLRWPVVGLGGVIVAGQLVSFRISTGTQTDLNMAVVLIALLLVAWIVHMLVQRQVRLVASAPVLAALALAGVAMFALLVGQHPWVTLTVPAPLAAQIGGAAIYVLSAGAFLLVAHRVDSERLLQLLTWTFLLVAAIFMLGEVARDFGAPIARLSQPGADGSLFWIWLAALASSQAIFNRRLHAGWRLALAMLVLASLFHSVVFAPEWLSGYLPALVALVVVLFSGSPRLGMIGVLVIGVAALLGRDAIAVALQGSDATAPFSAGWRDLLTAHVDADSSTRLEFWSTLGRLIQLDPWLGLGPANYAWYVVIFPTSQAAWGYLKISSHNNYVDMVAQTGLIGLACFAWFVAATGWLGWRLRARVPDGFSRAYVYGALGGLAGSLFAAALGDWFLPFVYNIGYDGFRASILGWLFLGGLVALEQIGHVAKGAQEPAVS